MHIIRENRLILGPEKLALLHAVRTGRGPMVSDWSKEKLVNRELNSLYSHYSTGDSEQFVLMHSATKEKIDHILQAAERLRFSVVSISPCQRQRPTHSNHDEEEADQI